MNRQVTGTEKSCRRARDNRGQGRCWIFWLFCAVALFFLSSAGNLDAASVTFAVIGDYGMGDLNEEMVADMVKSWNPDFIVTSGDDYYTPAGGAGLNRYDQSTGRYFCGYLKDLSTDSGAVCPKGTASINKFFPVLGNHDYSDPGNGGSLPNVYTAYFTLPGAGVQTTGTSGNERYYDFVQGPVHFFMLNSANLEPPNSSEEPDGIGRDSQQAHWLKRQLEASGAPWKVVVIHKPPFSSDDKHGNTPFTQWPYAAWGASVIISGHAHTYERIMRDGIVYFMNGLGGAKRYGFGAPVERSAFRYSAHWGAMKVTVTETLMHFEFRSIEGGAQGKIQDQYDLSPRDR